MIKQLIIITGILISFNSCKQTEPKKTEESEEKEIVETRKEATEFNSVADGHIENDSLAIVLKSELEKIALNKKFSIDKKPIQNRHDDNLMDTIVTRTYENTRLTSYKSTSEEWIYKARIENSEFKLNDFIKVGTKKYVVEKSLAIGIPTDILKIGNLEQTSQFILRFESGNLKTIEFDGHLD